MTEGGYPTEANMGEKWKRNLCKHTHKLNDKNVFVCFLFSEHVGEQVFERIIKFSVACAAFTSAWCCRKNQRFGDSPIYQLNKKA